MARSTARGSSGSEARAPRTRRHVRYRAHGRSLTEESMGFTSLTVPVPGGEIFATRRGEGDGPPTLLLHGGPGIGAEHLVSLVEELDGLIDGVLPQQRGLEPSTLV